MEMEGEPRLVGWGLSRQKRDRIDVAELGWDALNWAVMERKE
jgi:hypothetical protein